MESNGDFKVAAGPDMTQEKFGHCAFLHPNRNKVVLAGGFDGTNQYMKFSEEFIGWPEKMFGEKMFGNKNLVKNELGLTLAGWWPFPLPPRK